MGLVIPQANSEGLAELLGFICILENDLAIR